MRVFAALVPPETVVADLADFLDPRRDDPAARGLSWTDPQQWHVTVAFMGSARAGAVDAFLEQIHGGVLDATPPVLQVRGGGAFPVIERARLLYAGVDDASNTLARISASTRAAAARTGCSPDGRAFVAHLSLARSRRPMEATRWVRVLDTYVGPSWTPSHLAVIESHLGGGRPRYAVLDEIPLGPFSYTD